MTSQELIDALRGAGYEPRSYSGRGMYGNTCVAVELDQDESLWHLAWALSISRKASSRIFPDPTADMLGAGTIVYWPQYAWPQEDTDAVA